MVYRTQAEIVPANKNNKTIIEKIFDKLDITFGQCKPYRMMRKGHWERLEFDMISINPAKPTKWIRKEKSNCRRNAFEMNIMIELCLQCEDY